MQRIVKKDLLRRLVEEGLHFAPFSLNVRLDPQASPSDGYIRVQGHGLDVTFAFRVEIRWTQLALRQAAERAGPRTERTRELPLLVLPHLSENHLRDLGEAGVSGLDFSGNGLLFDPPRLFALRSGAKPRLKPSTSTSFIYHSRNVSSLVPRVFLFEPFFTSVQDVLEACRTRMMTTDIKPALSLPTVSKALARLEEDLIVQRRSAITELLDPERLLVELERSFEMPAHGEPFLGKTTLDSAAIWSQLKTLRPHVRAVATGRASAGQYTGLSGPERLQLYVSDIATVREALAIKPTRAFPNIELIETLEEGAYFDAREGANELWASPLQTYLELSRGGGREIDVSQQLRPRLLKHAVDRRA